MRYRHTGRFIPDGEDKITSSTEVREVTFITDNVKPGKEEVNKAKIQLQDKINAYSARNYWKLKDILTTYETTPWNSRKALRKVLREFTSPYSRTRSCTKDIQFISVDHDSRADISDIKKKLESKYNMKVHDCQLEEEADTVTRFYTTWQTEVN